MIKAASAKYMYTYIYMKILSSRYLLLLYLTFIWDKGGWVKKENFPNQSVDRDKGEREGLRKYKF